MRVVYLIGLPGTGKTHVVREFMKRYATWVDHTPIKLLDSHATNRIRVLGRYDEGETFAGTDRLSMAVNPQAIEWVELCPPELIIGEGDRLNNKAFFKACQKKRPEDLTILHLTVSDEERERRYKERGSNQSDKFIQTVRTKVKNIVEEFGPKSTLFGEEPGFVKEMRHETPEDTIEIVKYLMEQVKEI
jgi:hypothetical protein